MNGLKHSLKAGVQMKCKAYAVHFKRGYKTIAIAPRIDRASEWPLSEATGAIGQ